MLSTTLICILAGIGAGLGTGFAGISAATVISPMLTTLVGLPAYQSIGIALASDVLASAASSRTYAKNHNIDIQHGLVMLVSVLIMTAAGSFLASLVPNTTLGSFSTLMTLFLGVKFLVRPTVNTNEENAMKTPYRRMVESLICGLSIGFICGFIGAGGGLMMLFVLTSILGYDLKTAVGTSTFVMTFTAFTGAMSHMVIGGIPNLYVLVLCIIATLISAQIGSMIANHVDNRVLNRITGGILTVIGGGITVLRLMAYL
ncbi:MAG: sulfite exporter TauE/SafE family protein [Butyricicoccus sp.]